MKSIKDHIDTQSQSIFRGKQHSTPDAEEDITQLGRSYHTCRIHQHIRGRCPKNEDDKAEDFVAMGTAALQKRIKVWNNERNWERSTKEDEEELKDDNR